jgi:acyl-CoA thioesterase-1
MKLAIIAAIAPGPGCRESDGPPAAAPPLVAPPPAAPEARPPLSPASGLGSLSRLPPLEASPLVSRGKRVVGRSPLQYPRETQVNDENRRTGWGAGKPTPEHPSWIAIDIGKGPTRLLLNWSSAGSFNYEETEYGSPGAYRIETSADSSDGVDGSWNTVVTESKVVTHGQAHSFDFKGRRWVRFVVTGAPEKSPNGVQIDEIRVYDASRGQGDTWFFMGDSITAFAFGRTPEGEPGFSARVRERHPRYFPALINGGVGGHKSAEGARLIDQWLARNPDAHFWCLGYGTNDAANNTSDTSHFKENMSLIIERVRQAGRVAILATIPFASDDQHRTIPLFNGVIDDLQSFYALPRGPNLYAWFQAHPEELDDGVHPNDRGISSINRLWAEAVDPLYPREDRAPAR